MTDPEADGKARRPTPLEMLDVLASEEIELAPGLRHVEVYTRHGLLTVLWHGGPAKRAVVACGGAMGGLLGPAHGMYQRMGVEWAAQGIATLRVSYRTPNDLDACCIDVAAAVQLAVGEDAEQVAVMGHSFGGAVAVRVGVALPTMVAGVVTFATQSAGCEVAGGLAPRPLLMFHGERDEILPVEASMVVREIAGAGELIVLPNDGHLLGRSGDVMEERLREWLPSVLGSA
jgi:pimeloyl-ACP methyl ester carboxylesterase